MSNEYKDWLYDKKQDLYISVACALTHGSDCDTCKKCGKDSDDARMNLVRALAKQDDFKLPWEESEELTEQKLEEFWDGLGY